MLPESDRVRIHHIIDAAREAVAFTAHTTFTDASKDRQLQLARVRCVEIIGEAASRLAMSTRDNNSDIPWQDMIGMRNRLVHGYFDIDFRLVWRTVTEEIPALLPQNEAIISQ